MHYIGMTALHASAHMTHAPVTWRRAWPSPSPRPGSRSGSPAAGADVRRFCCRRRARHGDGRHALHGHGGDDALSARKPALGRAGAVDRPAGDRGCGRRLLVSGIFLLFLVPDRSAPRVGTATEGGRRCRRGSGRVATARRLPHRRRNRQRWRRGRARDLRAARRRRRPAAAAGAPSAGRARRETHFVAVDDVVAVHANAHYTYIFDGTAKLFCPLAIGDVESRLDSSRFVRVHRSHIVNIDFVCGLKRAGDNGVVELAARTVIPCRSAAAASAG